MRILPINDIFNTVYIIPSVPRIAVSRSWIRSWWCKHFSTVEYARIDAAGTPVEESDNYEGKCCINCGKILHEDKGIKITQRRIDGIGNRKELNTLEKS